MDLDYSADELAFRDTVRDWLRAHLPDDLRARVARYRPLARDDLARWHRILAAKGWIAPAWPAEWGGTGWNVVQRYIFEEECGYAGAPPLSPFGLMMCGPVLLRFGTAAQKERFLPRIYQGDEFWCQGYSEPGSGSDLASLRTAAVRDGDRYVVDGQKIWTTHAHFADWMFCLVRTSRESERRQDGISFLLIDMRSKGITVRPLALMDGGHEVNEVFLDGVEVPVANRVHDEGAGWTVAKYLLGHERMNTARIGTSRRELEKLKAYAATRTRDGRPLMEDTRFRDRLARLEIELMALSITNLRFLDALRAGRAPGAEVSMLKIRGTEIQQALTELMMEAAGPLAYALPGADSDPDDVTDALARRYCNSRKTTIYAGSNEIQRNIIARQVLGLLKFDVDEDARLLAESVQRLFADAYAFDARRRILASPEGWSRAIWTSFTELGLLGLGIDAAHGGFGGGATIMQGVMEAIGESLVVEPFLSTVGLGARLVERGATPARRTALLPAIVAGRLVVAMATTEHDSGYDVLRIGTRVRPDGDAFRLDGAKRVVLHAPIADLMIVSARSAGAEADVHGIELFLVRPSAPGVTLRPCRTLDGLHAADVVLDGVRVGADDRLGAPGEAGALLDEAHDFGTALACAEAIGALRSANAATLEYLKERRQFGAPIGSFQALQHRMVDMTVAYEQARSMAALACTTVDRERDARRRRHVVSAAKVSVADACRHISQEAVQLHGGMGMAEELKISHTFRRLTVLAAQFGDADHHLARFAATEEPD